MNLFNKAGQLGKPVRQRKKRKTWHERKGETALLPASLPASIKKDICPNRVLINTFIQTQAHHLLSLHSNALGEVQGWGGEETS